MSIKVTNLSKNYGTQKAVDNISFTIGKGEVVGFLGPNGAGKSTTMKMITGYLAGDAGSVSVCNDAVETGKISIKKNIGYLPEGNPLYFDMYVREYLEFVAGIHNISSPQNKIEEIITRVGLNLEANKKISQLSKGYKQRVGLAAALIHDPEVLILDEPTSGLDPNQIVEIRELIKTFGKNKTVLFSSHILQEVQAICDRVIIINKGKIVADDSINDLQKYTAQQHCILIHFKEPVAENTLLQLINITKVVALENNGFKLYTTDAESVRKQLLELSLKNNLNIVSLQSENNTLEDIFRTLTSPINL